MKWAKVDSSGQVVEITESDTQPPPVEGYTFQTVGDDVEVGDTADGHGDPNDPKQGKNKDQSGKPLGEARTRPSEQGKVDPNRPGTR